MKSTSYGVLFKCYNKDMQIISGIYKNKPIKSPDSVKTHPMGSREKLALFNMILPYLPSSKVLDAFAGSGALGLEALSRGADFVIFIENSGKVAKTIKENLTALGPVAISHAQIIVKDVLNFDADSESFDVILADPPYDHFIIDEVAHLIPFLKKQGIMALSHPGAAPEFPNLKLLKSHNYAAATISIYKKV